MSGSLEQLLVDSSALADIADEAGVSQEAAKRVAAGLATLPIRQAIRICVAAWKQQKRSGRTE